MTADKKFYGFDSCALHQCYYYFQLLCYVNKLLPLFLHVCIALCIAYLIVMLFQVPLQTIPRKVTNN